LGATGPGKPATSYPDELARGRMLEKSGKYEEARAVYAKLVTRYPDRYEAYHRLAVVADRQKHYREAEELYAKAIRLESGNADLYNDLGYCLFLQNKLDDAELVLLKAVSLAPAPARYRNNLGFVYGHQARYDEALEQFRQAGSEADAFYNLAFVLTAKDEIDGAKNCFRLALAADPSYDAARKALEGFREFESNPGAVLEQAPIADNGAPWIPYVEGAEGRSEGVQPASHTTTSLGSGVVPSTRATTRAQLRQARSGMAQGATLPRELGTTPPMESGDWGP
jgi:Tfp pilus assembly protein PilF